MSDVTGLVSNYSTTSGGIEKVGNKINRGFRKSSEPSYTLTSKCLSMTWHPSGIGLNIQQAVRLQGYDFDLVGVNSMQVGNAVPPPIAAAVLGELWT